MGRTAARPDDLDHFSQGSRSADRVLSESAAALRSAYSSFASRCQWGVLDAVSLVNAVDPQFTGFNEQDARWVETIAGAFRAADRGAGVPSLPDEAIAAILRQAGLSDVRVSVTFDDPVAYGFPPTSGYANDPVNTATGNFVEYERDLRFAGVLAGLSLERTYNSRSAEPGPFGRGWSSWATARLRLTPEWAEYAGPDGQRARFPRHGEDFGRVAGVNAVIERVGDGLALAWFGGARQEFDAAGLPVRTSRGPGTEVRLRHDDGERLVELAHEGGRSVALQWDGQRVVAAVGSDGRRVGYEYDGAGDLVAADRSGAVRRYEVDKAGRILSVADADGVVEVANVYDEEGRVVAQSSPFGRRTFFAYLPGCVTVTSDDDGGPANTYVHDATGRVTEIVDGEGQAIAFAYDAAGNVVRLTERGGAVTTSEWDERARLVRRTLPTGGELSYVYDEADRLVEVTASNGATTVLRYDGDERTPAEIVDPEGGVSRMTVAGGLVREVVDPDGVTLRFEFDGNGDLVATVDADGNVARLERDAAGRITAAITPLRRRTSFYYDERGLPVERHDPDGAIWRYEHTAAGRLTSVTDPTGAREETRYGEHGERAAIVDPLGHVTAERRDVFGNIAGVTAADGASWAYGYDALMRLRTIEDPAGGRWERDYDADGNLVASVDPAGTRRRAEVDPAGRVTELSDGLTSSSFEFDDFGRAIVHARPDGTQARCEFDVCGRRVAVHDPVGGVTRMQYSPGGKVLREISPSGRVDAYAYDACGRLAARVDGAGRRWENRYDADGAVVERVDPAGEITRYAYDASGRLAESSLPGRGVTRYEYDAAGRTSAIEDRAYGLRRFAYDAAGRLTAATDANGATTRYAHDARGRLTEITDPLGATRTRRYDAKGQLVAETDPLGRTEARAYDAAGRLVERVDGSGRTTRLSYDASGRVASYGAAVGEPVAIERDALGREIWIAEPGSSINELRWDGAGRLVERRRDELAMRWRYTEDGERAAIGYPDGTETAFARDAGGFLVAKTHPALGTIDLERDAAGRLVGAMATGMRARWRYERGDLAEYRCEAGGRTRTAQLTRDGVGRVVEAIVDGDARAFAYDRAGQLLSDGTRSYDYDVAGRLQREESAAGTLDYEHDAAGQLLTVRRGGATTQFEYDGAGRRTLETGAQLSRAWRWDALGRLAEVQTAAGGEVSSTRVEVDVLGELAAIGDTPLMWDTADAFAPLSWIGGQAVVGHGTPWALAGDGAAQWLAPDWQGTVGDVARDPWGAPLDGSGTGPGGRAGPGYRGEVEFDGQSWLRNRVYEPATRSFLSPDAAPPVPGTASAANPYHYAASNPVGLSDPLGLRPITDEELGDYRDRMDRNLFERGVDFVEDNAEYIVAGALIVGGIAVMATGVGGPIGAAMIGGALLSAGASAGMQQFTTGEVNWGQVVVAGVVGGAAGGLGAGAGMFVGGTGRLATASPWLRGAVVGGTENVVGGAANRGLMGDNPFDPRSMGVDLLTGGAPGAVGGHLGSRTIFPATADEMTARLGVDPVKVGTTPDATPRVTWEPDPLTRIRMESHPGGLSPGDPGFNPRHHDTHYHVEHRPTDTTGWNNPAVTKDHPPGYTPGSGTGFLPGERFPQ